MVAFNDIFTFPLLALSAAAGLLDPLKPDSKVARNVLEGKAEGYCTPSGPIQSTNCAYETVESTNKKLFPALHDLVAHPFFKYYKVDLYRECPFWQENGFCMNRACGIEDTDESQIPEKWRAQALGQVRHTSEEDGISSCYFRDDDFCHIEDDATPEGQYIDLTINPERFTGYAGESANQVWRAIYKENCFGLSEASLESGKARPAAGAVSPPQPVGFSKLSEGWGTEMVRAGLAPQDTCEEKKLYYRVISGLHASISIHICADYLDQQTGVWAPNLQCFVNRLATHPERLSNVYFNAVLLLRAVARAAPYFRAYDINIGPRGPTATCPPSIRESDMATREAFEKVLTIAEHGDIANGFDEKEFFAGSDAPILMDQFKNHFRNVSRIMDCVGCDKCRLWGKVQVTGIGTALKILFALDEKDLDPKLNPDLLQRSEVVALFNALHRLSESLNSVEEFRQMYAKTQIEEASAAKERQQDKARRKAENKDKKRAKKAKKLESSFSWSAVVATLISAFEAVRRSCHGCVQACVNTARELLSGSGKTEL